MPNHLSPAIQAILSYADSIIQDNGILNNAYFQSLQDGSMSKNAFLAGQKQFYYAVEFFSRPMAGLVAKIPDPDMRIDILHNLVEEHGEFNNTCYHAATFKLFLQSMGYDCADLKQLSLWPEIRAFNACLITACVHDELQVGVACMGIIEYLFADISALIGNAIVERRWISQEELVHYKLHAAIDKRHAQEFFKVVANDWTCPEKQYFIKQGLDLGLYIFNRLYLDLDKHAQLLVENA